MERAAKRPRQKRPAPPAFSAAAPPGTAALPPAQQSVLDVQRTAGNAAAVQLVSGGAPVSTAPPPAAQRPPAPPAPSEHPAVTKLNAIYAAYAAQPEHRVGLGPPAVAGGTIEERRRRALVQADLRGLTRITESELADARRDLIEAFQNEAHANAMKLLAQNEALARAEAGRYGEVSSGDPTTEANQLRKAAASLAHVQRLIVRRYQLVASRVAAAYGAPQGTATADKVDFYMENSPIAQSDPMIAKDLYPRFETLRRIWGLRFPILLTPGIDYSTVADASPAQLEAWVASSTGAVLENIAKAREMLTPERIWEVPMLVTYTMHTMGIPATASTPARSAIEEYHKAKQQNELLVRILLGAIGILLAAATIAVTLGAAAPLEAAGLLAFLGTAGAGLSLFGAYEEYERSEFQEAQAGSSLDPATALSREHPSLVWLAVAIVGAVVDLGAAAVAFRTLARTAAAVREARMLMELEEAARAQAEVLKAENKLLVGREQFVERIADAAKKNLAAQARQAEERVAAAVDRELAAAPAAKAAGKAGGAFRADLRRLVTDLRAKGLDPDAVRRVFAEAHDVDKIKGQLLEELFTARARALMQTPEGAAALARGGATKGLEFVEPHRITDLAGRKFSDGLVGTVDRAGRKFTVANIIEAKAGTSAKGKLSREAARLSRASEAELEEMREAAVDILLEKYHPAGEGAPGMLAKQNLYREKVAAEHPDEVRELMKDLFEQGESGQVRRDIERISPSVDLESGADIPAKIKIDGVEYDVVGASGSTPVTAVLPSDVGAGRLSSTLAKQGLDVVVEKMQITTGELEALAKRVEDAAAVAAAAE